jgi:hypothetical protein
MAGLKFQRAWRFASPGPAPKKLNRKFFDLIMAMAVQGDKQDVLEHFKSNFAVAAGRTVGRSSNAGWAGVDLQAEMDSAQEANAALFIEAFYVACEQLKNEIEVPDVNLINDVIARSGARFKIEGDMLVARGDSSPVAVASKSPSLEKEARDIIESSLDQSSKWLSEGEYRSAVSEIFWLLESVSTLFEGQTIGSDKVTGKYFNVIADELRNIGKGKVMDLALQSAKTFHGYLSAPAGGGVRHGADLKKNIKVTKSEALLFCNLARSFIQYLLDEHDRINGR